MIKGIKIPYTPIEFIPSIINELKMERNNIKKLGQVSTPHNIVCEMLDLIGYTENNPEILNKLILEPSCGDGSFLCEIVIRYIKCALKNNLDEQDIKSKIEENICGFEIDYDECVKCSNKIKDIVKELLDIDGYSVFPDIRYTNTLYEYKNKFNIKKFDYIIGNPPYVKIHNINVQDKNFIKENMKFSKGSFDLYMSFFEIGLEMLKDDGKLCYITPNSWLKNTSCKKWRNYLDEQNLISYLKDYGTKQLFHNVTTYSSIVILDKNRIEKRRENDTITEYMFEFQDQLNQYSIATKNKMIGDYFNVQYGLCTLCDKVFISDKHVIYDKKYTFIDFNDCLVDVEMVKKVNKASKNYMDQIILFPYKEVNGKFVLMDEYELMYDYPHTYEYLLKNKDRLLKRDIKGKTKWYEYGRSQGIQNMKQQKISVGNVFKDKIIINKINEETLIYSGIFITKKENCDISWEDLEIILKSKDFFNYCYENGKDMRGGYKTITANIIKNYKLNK